ncbi:hypothetical protein GEV33_000806 [Tenebrio molitor]|uniref:Uncharacterized protein n=1 Tax=Tenebrio molitor TaxID=7067 RepID=A0A8J6HWH5_TENMO|nr:hypothetical protein GEV33_000806 [Tenebrio molitor]
MTDERLFERAHKIPPLIHGLEEDFFSKECFEIYYGPLKQNSSRSRIVAELQICHQSYMIRVKILQVGYGTIIGRYDQIKH